MNFDVAINLTTVLLILTITYLLWNFSERKSKEVNSEFYKIAQPCIFILFYFGAIYFTGLYKSNFKFLFIFLIVSYTIERGLRGGLAIAGVSSSIIFIMDLMLVPKSNVNYYLEDDLSLIGLFFIIATTIGYYVSLEKAHIRHLNALVNQDMLTGLYNHRYFHECLTTSLKTAKTNKQALSLLMCDMDYFKQFNDIHGHQGGDELLHSVAAFFTENLSTEQTVFRYGGDEFAVLLPNASSIEAKVIANNLREKFSEKIFAGEEYLPNEKFTMSIGISTFEPSQKAAPNLLRDADEALYKAKFFRRNRVETYISILDELNLNEKVNIESERMFTSIKTLISVINSRDKFTYTHLQRVMSYCKLFADDIGLQEEDKKLLCYAAYIHDIGKIDLPKEIVAKTGDLTQEEWEVLKTHPAIGAEMIKNVESLNKVYEIILQHHERFDGEGYPNRVKGTDISYLARVLTVVDAFDAMTSERPYQAKKTYLEGIQELKRCRGNQFDPDVVDQFIESITNKKLAGVVLTEMNAKP